MGAADRLFALVDAKYKEQREFAADLGITPSIVSEWRRGKSESFTKEKHISRICEVLCTTPEYILTGKGAPSQANTSALNPMTSQFVHLFESLSAEDKNQIVSEMLRRKNKK